ncbi:hypothetical protein [Phaffia rhodozyma]|uniref:Uncharacterized protein n=1 Tax=Phaffia rhodozyma TaxID=264483 RepID=A0A0F7SW03_PHARH|nr:hypothetical protein [Phaffia rhodozyma]
MATLQSTAGSTTPPPKFVVPKRSPPTSPQSYRPPFPPDRSSTFSSSSGSSSHSSSSRHTEVPHPVTQSSTFPSPLLNSEVRGPKGYTPLNDPPLSAKAKGKKRATVDGWIDLERGVGSDDPRYRHDHLEEDESQPSIEQEESEEMNARGWDPVGQDYTSRQTDQSYPPPLSEAEQEEKRIADNLAMWKERELSRRRAARESKMLRSSGSINRGSLSDSSFTDSLSFSTGLRLGSRSGSISRNSRWSFWGGAGASIKENPESNQTIPHAYTHPHPGSHPEPNLNSNARSQPTLKTPMSPTSPGPISPDFEYRGQQWMGGAGSDGQDQVQGRTRPMRTLGFWESWCGTGRDEAPGEIGEDDGDDQVGKTNPFE